MRQAQIAALLAAGLSHQQIAARLGVKRNTVIAHSRQIYIKLDVHDSRGLRRSLLARHIKAPVPFDAALH